MLFGLSLCVFFVEMTKSCVGSLRPYFFAVCQPNMTITNCTGTEYIMDYVCTQKYEDLLIDARYVRFVRLRIRDVSNEIQCILD